MDRHPVVLELRVQPPPSAGVKGSCSKGGVMKRVMTRKKARTARSVPVTYGMNSRFRFRLNQTASAEKNDRLSAQKRSDPRWPAQSPEILK
jgi:hypothetical protein